MTKTTNEDFEYFKKRCQHWIDFWGIHEYSVEFEHKEEPGKALATNLFDASVYCSTINLSISWNIKVTKEELDMTAFHEVVHLLLGRLQLCASSRYLNDEEIGSAIESIIKRMENCVFKKLK